MWSEQLKSMIVKFKNDSSLSEKLEKDPDSIDLSFLSPIEKKALIEVFTSRKKLATTVGQADYWY